MHKKIDSFIGMSYFGVVFNAGGIWEQPGRRGCSHLMEHLMCKTYQDLYPEMRRHNVVDNAVTTDNRVVFWARGLDECLSKFSQIMLDRLTKQEKLWTEEQFDNEKKVVLQEYGVCFNHQLGGTYYNLMRKHYKYGGPIGIRSDIEGFTYEDSLELAKELFQNPRLICTVGNHDVSFDGEFKTPDIPNPVEFSTYDLELETVPKEEQAIVFLVHRKPLGLGAAAITSLISSCISEGLESPLYQEVREKRGLAYGVGAYECVMGNRIVPLVGAETREQTKDELIKVFNDFFSQKMEDIISEERFETCKSGLIYDEREAHILPHIGALKTVMGDFNPYERIGDLEYHAAMRYANHAFSLDNFEIMVH